jgi:hypothetical protein
VAVGADHTPDDELAGKPLQLALAGGLGDDRTDGQAVRGRAHEDLARRRRLL